MKTTSLGRNARNVSVNAPRRQAGLELPDRQTSLSLMRTQRTRIQWPTGQELQSVSKHLARISREGRRCELAGDYFKSGDLAYQVQEIIRLTGDLFKKSQRTKT